MTDNTTTVPTSSATNQVSTNGQQADPLNELVRAFGNEAGKRIGAALAEEIHEDPEARRAAAVGAGVGVGVVAGLALFAAIAE